MPGVTRPRNTHGMSKPPPCPRCSSASIPIVYGLPGFEVFEAADRGEVRLGGCVVDGEEPRWACPVCEVEFA